MPADGRRDLTRLSKGKGHRQIKVNRELDRKRKLTSLKLPTILKFFFFKFCNVGQGNTSRNLWNVFKRRLPRQPAISQYSPYSDSYIYRLMVQKEPLRSYFTFRNRIILGVRYRVQNPDTFLRTFCTLICLINTRYQQFWMFYFPES